MPAPVYPRPAQEPHRVLAHRRAQRRRDRPGRGFPRSASGDSAARCSRARRGARRCPCGQRRSGSPRAADSPGTSPGRPCRRRRPSPPPGRRSSQDIGQLGLRRARSSCPCRRRPRPPSRSPGSRCCQPRARLPRRLPRSLRCPGMTGMPRSCAECFARILSPRRSMTSGSGPTKMSPLPARRGRIPHSRPGSRPRGAARRSR